MVKKARHDVYARVYVESIRHSEVCLEGVKNMKREQYVHVQGEPVQTTVTFSC